MKVFISHSSSDKWAARKVSEDLERLGVETFLDEKDLRTGESIDTSIGAHLMDSDHFLILLSPASVSSHWVLVELGGAIALKKHLVPVLLYLGANDIPAPIQRFLARDINDLQKYYEELTTRPKVAQRQSVEKKVAKKRAEKKAVHRPLKIGDTVRLVAVRPKLDSPEENRFGWANSMDVYLGTTTTVAEIEKRDGHALHRLQVDDGEHAWYRGWLEVVNAA